MTSTITNAVKLSEFLEANARETLIALFVLGPLYDGDVPSKVGRDRLVELEMVDRYNGWQTLTQYGLKIALEMNLDRDKEKRAREIRELRAK